MYTLVQYLAGTIGVWIACVQVRCEKCTHAMVCATHNSYQCFWYGIVAELGIKGEI